MPNRLTSAWRVCATIIIAGLVLAIDAFTLHDKTKAIEEETLMLKVLVAVMFAATTYAAAQDAAAIGEEVYDQHCQSCHGEKLRSAGAIPDLRELGASDREKFDKMVMEGRGQMPAWEGIVSPQELDQLWAYVRSRAR